MWERRRAVRWAVQLPATVRSGDDAAQGKILDISRFGMMVESGLSVVPAQVVAVETVSPAGSHYAFRGVVVWNRSAEDGTGRFGLRLDGDDEGLDAAVRQCVMETLGPDFENRGRTTSLMETYLSDALL